MSATLLGKLRGPSGAGFGSSGLRRIDAAKMLVLGPPTGYPESARASTLGRDTTILVNMDIDAEGKITKLSLPGGKCLHSDPIADDLLQVYQGVDESGNLTPIEYPHDAVKREIFEELGVDITGPKGESTFDYYTKLERTIMLNSLPFDCTTTVFLMWRQAFEACQAKGQGCYSCKLSELHDENKSKYGTTYHTVAYTTPEYTLIPGQLNTLITPLPGGAPMTHTGPYKVASFVTVDAVLQTSMENGVDTESVLKHTMASLFTREEWVRITEPDAVIDASGDISGTTMHKVRRAISEGNFDLAIQGIKRRLCYHVPQENEDKLREMLCDLVTMKIDTESSVGAKRPKLTTSHRLSLDESDDEPQFILDPPGN